jgi:hypothetical protein
MTSQDTNNPTPPARRATDVSPRREPWVTCGPAQPLQGRKNAAALCVFLLCCVPAFAAISGTVVNGTTGKPQPGATVDIDKLDQNGPSQLAEVKTDAQGAFSVSQSVDGPALVRSTLDGVTYNLMIPPGTPSTGVKLEVFNASKEPGEAKVSKHMLLFQPSGGQMTINETFLLSNPGKTSWNDPGKGALHFYLPAAAAGKAEVNATEPGGMPIAAELVKSAGDISGIDFPIKPGETRIDITYSVPYTEGAAYQGKIVSKDGDTYLIAPNGVTLEGAGLNDLGLEPKTNAHIYGLPATAYKIKLTGTPLAAENSGADASADSPDAADGSPQVEQVLPHISGEAKLILGLALGVLALGFAILYRAGSGPQAKETNERGRG